MGEDFDPYFKWLGIPPEQQPPHHYRLLGVPEFTDDADVISHAVDRLMAHLRTFQSGPNSAHSQKLLNEISGARVCLLNADSKAEYDHQLRLEMDAQQQAADISAEVPDSSPTPPSSSPETSLAMDALPTTPQIRTKSAAVASAKYRHQRRKKKTLPVVFVLVLIVAVSLLGIALFKTLSDLPGRKPVRGGSTSAAKQQPDYPSKIVVPERDYRPDRKSVANDKPSREVPRHAMLRLIWNNGNGTGLFTDKLNWQNRDEPVANHTLPGNFLDVGDDPSTLVDSPIDDTTNAVIQSGGTVTLNRNFTAANPFDQLIVRIGSGLNISADLTATTILSLGAVDGHSDFINQTAGTVSVSSLTIGSGTGTYSLRGGALILTTGMTIENDSTFSLQGDTASVSARFLTLSQTTMESPTLEFQFGAGGVNPIALKGLFTIDSTYAGLTIDGSSYRGGARTIELVSYGQRSGSFADKNIRISGFQGLIGTIEYDADSMILVLSPKPSDAKPAVPDTDVREEARAALENSYELEFRQATNQQQKQALARKLIRDGENTKDNLAIQYELFRIARNIAIDVGDVTLAMDCVAHTVSSFNVDAVRLKASTLNALAKGRGTQTFHEELVDHFDAVIDDALAADRFDIATPLVKIALTSARKTGNKKIIKTASQRSKDITQMEEAHEKVKEALATLETNPVDPGANTVAGKYLCFHKGDWERGLSYLALGEDGDSRDLARKEIAKSSEYLALGNGWWEIARSFDKRRANVIRLHAASKYQHALPTLEGLTKTKIEDRLRGLGDTDDP